MKTSNKIIVSRIYEYEEFYIQSRLKSKAHIVLIWLETIKKILNSDFEISGYSSIDQFTRDMKSGQTGFIIIDLEEAKRIHILDLENPTKKLFSICFPFSIIQQHDRVQIKPINLDVTLDLYLASKLTKIFKNIANGCSEVIQDGSTLDKRELSHHSIFLSEAKEDVLDDHNDNLTDSTEDPIIVQKIAQKIFHIDEIFYYLLGQDDGYLRFDYDTDNSSEERIDYEYRYLHPTRHIDIFWSQGSFKLGIEEHISIPRLKNILSPKSNCLFLMEKKK